MGKKEDGFPIWRMEYPTLTDNIEVDIIYGAQFTQLKKETFLSSELSSLSYEEIDYSLISGAVKKYNMNTRPLNVYTDGSKSGESTGASLVCDEEDIAYYVSMPKICSTFTAEAFAIRTALDIIRCSYRTKG